MDTPPDRCSCTTAPPVEALRTLLRRLAGQVLAEASALGAPASPVCVAAGDDVLTLTVVAAPSGAKTGRPLTPCERDVLALLERAATPMSTSRVVGALTRRGQLHGSSTVARALIRLTK